MIWLETADLGYPWKQQKCNTTQLRHNKYMKKTFENTQEIYRN